MRDVNALVRDCFTDRPDSRRCHEKTKNRSERRSNATDANAVDYGFTRCGGDHDDVMTRGSEIGGEVLQVEFDAADARMIPVADEGDFQTLLSLFVRCQRLDRFFWGAQRYRRARDPLERREHAIDLLTRMFSRHRHANAACVRRYGRRKDRMCENAVVEERTPCFHCLEGVADQHGNHRRLRLADVETQRTEPFGDASCVLPQADASLRFSLENVERGERTGDGRRRHARSEDQRAAVMAQVLNHVGRTCDDTAHRRERLRERRQDQIDVIAEPEVTHSPRPVLAQYTERVGFVDENGGAMLLADGNEPRQLDDAPFHREDAIRGNELPGLERRARKLARQRVDVTVRVSMHFAKTDSRSVDKRCVIEPIQENVIVAADQRSNRAETRLISRRENQRCGFAEERGKPRLEFVMKVESTVEESAAR
jgi:hypothetical protein